MKIDSFSGDNRFLSNFFPSPIKMDDGKEFPTVEHAYQWMKCLFVHNLAYERLADMMKEIQFAKSPGIAKKLGQKVPIDSKYWEKWKVEIMEQLLRRKFEIPELRDKLIATGNKELIEGNWWGDVFWGVCNEAGQNYLGRLLMKIREEIKKVTPARYDDVYYEGMKTLNEDK